MEVVIKGSQHCKTRNLLTKMKNFPR